jgi:hypothetical protein
MKKYLFLYLLAAISLLSLPAFSQNKDKKNEAPKEDTTPLLGLAGDNLDLYAVLDLFQKSKTVEAFEKSLNDADLKINNIDLNLDKKIDFIKVVTNKEGDSYQFILRVDVTKTESQDVAVILLDKDKDKKISLQIVGDEELYGKDYVIEPKGNSTVTPNPGYKGADPVLESVPATTTTVVVQSAPIVQYVYSPAYVPYMPPYYYGYYPPWFGFATVMAVGIYRSNHYYGHGGYYGGHYHGGNNNVIINNGSRNNINHYNNNSRNRSTTVANNKARGNYGDGAGANRRNQSPSVSNNMSNTRQSSAGSNRQTPSMSNNMSTRQSPSASNRQSPSASNSMSNRQSSNFNSSSRSSASSYGGGGRSMGGGGGGGGRSGGGGGRRR